MLFEGSPVTAFEDFQPAEEYLETGVYVAIDSFFRQDLNPVAKFIHYESFEPIVLVTNLLQINLGKIWCELFTARSYLRFAKSRSESLNVERIMKNCVAVLDLNSGLITAHRNELLVPLVEEWKSAINNELLQLWWQTGASDKDNLELIRDFWGMLKEDTNYMPPDVPRIWRIMHGLCGFLQCERATRLDQHDKRLRVFQIQLSLLRGMLETEFGEVGEGEDGDEDEDKDRAD
ncbi:hypothetical protein IWX90DRAFT_441034, partial [Phyllosticta citrichinensis]